MIKFVSNTRIFLSTSSVDFRKGIDGLSGVCRKLLKKNPMNGAMFVFKNKKGTAIKILYHDRTGYWLCMKRLSTGKFWWPESIEVISTMTASQLTTILLGQIPHNITEIGFEKVG